MTRGGELAEPSGKSDSGIDRCFVRGIARKFASSGYGVFAMDYPGFGLSKGLHGYNSSFDRLVDAVIEHYSIVRENNQGLPCFLLGQSMGGSSSSRVRRGHATPWLVKQILIGVAKILPKGIRQRWDLETQSRKKIGSILHSVTVNWVLNNGSFSEFGHHIML
ncbi:uncharacterized protein LOC130140248 [Syzygium oleosum]|uniref:uncharacterized protein LOC130140248 n=1 Tax=Syzygium oleosum TaxID=219896 RepID=UPI0024B9BFBE|nr:uncharacterized protein LOC130140248 [Syzygium oleosum]